MTKTTKKSAVGYREHIKEKGRQEGIQKGMIILQF